MPVSPRTLIKALNGQSSKTDGSSDFLNPHRVGGAIEREAKRVTVGPRYAKQMTRGDVAEYLLMVLSWDGVVGEKGVMAEAVQRWAGTPGLSFADAYLAAVAGHRGCLVYTKNVRELRGQGANAPDPLPDETGRMRVGP